MTVPELMVQKGYARPGAKKCRCPSGIHADNSPSALINPNSVYCFSCGKIYGLKFLEKKFSVVLDKQDEEMRQTLTKTRTVLFRE